MCARVCFLSWYYFGLNFGVTPVKPCNMLGHDLSKNRGKERKRTSEQGENEGATVEMCTLTKAELEYIKTGELKVEGDGANSAVERTARNK